MKKNYVDRSPQRRALLKYILIMKAIWILVFVSVFHTFGNNAHTYAQNTRLSLNVKDASLEQIIWSIEKQSDFSFFYNTEDVKEINGISFRQKGATAEEILSEILKNSGLTYEIVHKTIIISKSEIQNVPINSNEQTVQQPQKKTLNGTVKDSKGVPLPGVTIVAKGTTTGTITDFDGNFTLDVPVATQVISVSFVGMKSQDIELANKVVFNIVLEEETVGIDEVVVVGYGQQKKMTVTGSLSAVTAEQLVQSPVANISNSLAGRATGVLSVQRSGAPGEDQAEIRIRGVGTYTGLQSPLIMVDGIETANYNNIDPNEIENISILKDASSTAVYGVRGANGVILITTKRGKLGKPQISYSGNLAGTTLIDVRERMGAVDYASLYNEALKYDSYITGAYNPFFTDAEIELYRNQTDPVFYPDVNWMDMFYKDVSFQKQHNLNIRGGSELMKYFVSLGMFDQEGLFNNTDVVKDFFDQNSVFKRYNFRSNFDFNVTKRLTAKFNIAAKVENKRGYNAGNVNQLIRAVSNANPITTPAIIDGKFVDIPAEKAKGNNPFTIMYDAGHRKTYRNFIEGSFRLDYDLGFITKGLEAHGTVSFENFNSYHVTYNKPVERYTAVKDANNQTVFLKNFEEGAFSTGTGNDKRRQTYMEAGLNYARTFGSHSITGLLLYNQQKTFDPGFQFLIPSGYQGLVGRLTYDYKNRYLVEYNAGYNGTENFAPGNRFGFFPAYSLGWVLSEEPFFPKNKLVSFIKLRGSYGEVGNDRIGGSRFLYLPSAYTYSSQAYYWGEVGSSAAAYGGAYEGKIGNPELTWERAKKSNVGIDITMFQDKLRITADLFQEKRDNILTSLKTVPVTAGMGSNLPAVNIGKVENSGFDGEITYNNKIRKFNYWVKANYTFARNMIVYQDEIPNPYPYLMRTGQPVGQLFGYIDAGLYNSWTETNDAYRPVYNFQNNRIQPGVINWKDINGDGLVDQYDQGPIGYSNFPEVSYGMSLGGDWKGFDFSVLFQGASHVSFMGQGSRYTNGWHNWLGNNEYLKNSWTLERYEQGLPIYYPHFNVGLGPSQLNQLKGTFYTKDASYIRLRNVEIGYRFDELKALKGVVKSFRIYLNGSNLWTYAYRMNKMYPGVDPEDLSESDMPENTEPYPRVAVYNIGINVNF